MNWFLIMQAMTQYLIDQPALDNVPVQTGQTVPVPEETTVTLIRGPATPRSNDRRQSPELVVFVECWVRDDSDDPAAGYQRIAELESAVIDSINDFAKGDRRIDGKPLKVRVGTTEPDGDAFRPMVGSRTQITISWL